MEDHKMYSWKDVRDTALFDDSFDGVDAVAMQFTGLLDNQGREIYEGDILRVITHGDWLDEHEYMYNVEVKFEQKEFGECDGCGWIYIPKKREVIGNIFETPELLKKSS